MNSSNNIIEKNFKYILIGIVAILLICFFVSSKETEGETVQDSSKSELFSSERVVEDKTTTKRIIEDDIKRILQKLNSNLPVQLSSTETLDSVVFRDKTIFYERSVRGGEEMKQFYYNNYTGLRDMYKYSLITMNGQRNLADRFIPLLKKIWTEFWSRHSYK